MAALVYRGGVLSFLGLCSLVLLALVLVSLSFNAYMAWQLSGFEVVVVKPAAPSEAASTKPFVALVTATPAILAAQTTEQTSSDAVDAASNAITDPDSLPATGQTNTQTTSESLSEAPAAALPLSSTTEQTSDDRDLTTNVPAVDTQISGATDGDTAEKISTSPADDAQPSANNAALTSPTTTDQPQTAAATNVDASAPASESEPAVQTRPQAAPQSNNEYKLIPIEGNRESTPTDQHGDLNLALRKPHPTDDEKRLIDYTGKADDDTPNLQRVLDPNSIITTYKVHQWDWDCKCPKETTEDGILVGIKTTPGQSLFIPHRNAKLFQGEYQAVLLYASENSLTFVYERKGTVATGYTVHYHGLQVDPNLLQIFRQSSGNELPGLTLDTPVGIATEQLIVGVRDKGTFMDTRSRKDWWR